MSVEAQMPLVAALGNPAVCLPTPVTLLFALLAPGIEKFKSIGLDSFSKTTLLRHSIHITQLTQRAEVVFSVLIQVCTHTGVYSHRYIPTTVVTPRLVLSPPQEARTLERLLPGPPPPSPQP